MVNPKVIHYSRKKVGGGTRKSNDRREKKGFLARIQKFTKNFEKCNISKKKLKE